ncbi:DUF6292 family protein [Lentzea sp. NPDC051208]|uniref:DUF6292 family protein n=1 Tax=Lentzea sp. NPDC051208 TaxID=3154642 RepID=UPI003426C044
MELDFELDFDDTAARVLRDYVHAVSTGLGLRGESSFVAADHLSNAYVALEGQLRDFPHDDVALLWDERNGWAAAIENARSGDLVVVARLDGEVTPPPSVVVTWVRALLQPGSDGAALSAFRRAEPLDARLPAPRSG